MESGSEKSDAVIVGGYEIEITGIDGSVRRTGAFPSEQEAIGYALWLRGPLDLAHCRSWVVKVRENAQ